MHGVERNALSMLFVGYQIEFNRLIASDSGMKHVYGRYDKDIV